MKYKFSLFLAMTATMLLVSATCFADTQESSTAGASISMPVSGVSGANNNVIFNPSPQVWVNATSSTGAGFSVHAVHNACLDNATKGGKEYGMASDSTAIFFHDAPTVSAGVTTSSANDSSLVRTWTRTR